MLTERWRVIPTQRIGMVYKMIAYRQGRSQAWAWWLSPQKKSITPLTKWSPLAFLGLCFWLEGLCHFLDLSQQQKSLKKMWAQTSAKISTPWTKNPAYVPSYRIYTNSLHFYWIYISYHSKPYSIRIKNDSTLVFWFSEEIKN